MSHFAKSTVGALRWKRLRLCWKDRMIARTLLLVFTFCLIALVDAAPSIACKKDKQCNNNKVCHNGDCIALAEGESLIRIKMDEWVPNANLYIDGILMGAAPWEGVISSGLHTIRVQAKGYEPMIFTGTARDRRRETINVKLLPSAAVDGPPEISPREDPLLLETPPVEDFGYAPLPEEPSLGPGVSFPSQRRSRFSKNSTALPGVMTLGVSGEGGYGSAKWGSASGYSGWYALGGTLGAALARERVWFEMVAVVKYGQHFFPKWSTDLERSEFKELRLGVQLRLLFPVKEKRLYLGFEAELGGMLSHLNYLYVDFRGALSVFPHPVFEIRFSPVGVEWVHDFEERGRVLGLSGNIGFVFRPV